MTVTLNIQGIQLALITKYIFVDYIVSEILVKNQKLVMLIIHDREVPFVYKKYIPSMGQIQCTVDNKKIVIQIFPNYYYMPWQSCVLSECPCNCGLCTSLF